MNKKILFLALEFPPVQTTGIFRSMSLASRFHAAGIEPIVVRVDPEDGVNVFGSIRNDSLFDAIPTKYPIYDLSDAASLRQDESAIAAYLRLLFNLSDGYYRRFIKSFEEQLKAVLTDHSPSAIYCSLPPFGAGKLAQRAARMTGLPLIVDMRDSWSQFDLSGFPTWLHYRYCLREERGLFEQASIVTTVTDNLKQVFIETHPHVDSDKFHTIPNGFEGPKFETDSWFEGGGKGGLHIGYVGSFYYSPERSNVRFDRPQTWHRALQYHTGKEDWSYRSPQYFFKAWKKVNETNAKVANRIRFHLFGRQPAWFESMAREYGVWEMCRCHGFLERQKLETEIAAMDYMLSTSMKRSGPGDYCLASKTFDYLRAERPIIGFVTKGSQREFLEKSGVALVADADQVDDNAKLLTDLATSARRLKLDSNYVNGFHRSVSADHYLRLIEGILSD